MHRLEEIKDQMIEKIEDVYKDHSSLEPAVLDYIDKLAHAAKCIDKLCGGEASFRVGGYTYEGGDGSYARGRMNAKRDSMGRYSRDYSRGRWDSKIEDLIKEAPDDETRQELQKIAEKMR